jgi:hypothetical protein
VQKASHKAHDERARLASCRRETEKQLLIDNELKPHLFAAWQKNARSTWMLRAKKSEYRE